MTESSRPRDAASQHSGQLVAALGINLALLIAEVIGGILAGSAVLWLLPLGDPGCRHQCMLLFGVGIVVLVEAIHRLVSPGAVSSGLMLGFGVVALVGNGIAAWPLLRGQRESLTMRGAFLDFVADALGALAVVAAAVVILKEGADGPKVLDRLAECLNDHFDIEHSTFQLEPAAYRDHESSTHP